MLNFLKQTLKLNLGQTGENQALRYLKKKGYRCIERNFRCKLGEIDLVMIDAGNLVIVEVKSGTQKHYPAYGHFNHAKKKKLIQLAQVFLLKNTEHAERGIRFDLVTYEPFEHVPIKHFINVIDDIHRL